MFLVENSKVEGRNRMTDVLVNFISSRIHLYLLNCMLQLYKKLHETLLIADRKRHQPNHLVTIDMYVCVCVYKGWALKSSPCTTTFNDL
jgi:hypothetical protein